MQLQETNKRYIETSIELKKGAVIEIDDKLYKVILSSDIFSDKGYYNILEEITKKH